MSKTTIKELRAANKLTQAAFAKAIGVSAASVAAYEAGRTGPSEKVVARIRELYGADLEIEKAEKSTAKKPAAKKPAAKKPAGKKPAARKAKKPAEKPEAVVEAEKPARKTRKPAARKAAVKKAVAAPVTEVVIQSPMGGSITPEEILAKVGPADRIYVRVDENKAYWVRGEETGSVDLW